jgi:hypothetical protein
MDTAEQILLPFSDPADAPAEPATIQQRFEKFIADHPDVMALFRDIAIDLKSRGVRRYGAKAIMEICRYHKITSGPDDRGFKVNNDYSSRAARKLADEMPEFKDFFEFRELKSE